MALHLGRNGARVVVAEWKVHRVERVVAELEALGIDALGLECNILERASIDAMVDATVARFGAVDALINNAHTFSAKVPMTDVDEVDLDLNHGTVKGTVWAMQAVHPHMASAGWGRIVNFVSAAGITGMRGYGAYNASKEAIRALTRTAAREWGREGIVVNAIAPGAASKRGLESAARNTEAHAEFMKHHPIGRQGDPETDIGPVALFLCSDACRFITGQTFMVDGGGFLFA